MVGKKILCACITLVVCTRAQDVHITLAISNAQGETITQVVQGLPFFVHVTIEGENQQRPELEHARDFAQCTCIQTGTQITFANGVQRTIKKYTYRCRTDRIGQMVLGPAVIETGTRRVQSAAISCESVPFKKNEQKDDPKLELRVNADTQVYQGQQILLKIRLVSKIPLTRCALESFTITNATMGKQLEPVQEQVGTSNSVLYQIFIYPKYAGTLVIPSLTALCEYEKDDHPSAIFGQLRAFFGQHVETAQVHSTPITVNVKQLPPTTQQIAATGRLWNYRLSAENNTFSIERATNVTTSLTGQAYMDSTKWPLQVPDGLRIYESRVITTSDAHTNNVTTKQIEYVVQALRPGTFVIQAPELHFFDPQDNAYKTLPAQQITLRATKTPVAPKSSKIGSSKPIQSTIPVSTKSGFSAWFIQLSVIFSVFACLALFAWIIYSRPLCGVYTCQLMACIKLRRHVHHACTKNNCNELYAAWRNFFARILRTTPQSITWTEMEHAGLCILSPNEHEHWRSYLAHLHACMYAEQCETHRFLRESNTWAHSRSWWRISSAFCILSMLSSDSIRIK